MKVLITVFLLLLVVTSCSTYDSIKSSAWILDKCSDADTRIKVSYDQTYYVNGKKVSEEEARTKCKEVQTLKKARKEPGVSIKY